MPKRQAANDTANPPHPVDKRVTPGNGLSLFAPANFPFFTLLPPATTPTLCFPDFTHTPPTTSGQEAFRETFDRLIHAGIGRATRFISPMALSLAIFNWQCHLAISPGKQLTLLENGIKNWLRFTHYSMQALTNPATPPCIAPLPQDRRFVEPEWRQVPFNILYQGHLLVQAWWHRATTGIHGVNHHHEQLLTFLARQSLDVISPSNFIATNPVVLKATLKQGGANLFCGFNNCFEDMVRTSNQLPPKGAEAYRPANPWQSLQDKWSCAIAWSN